MFLSSTRPVHPLPGVRRGPTAPSLWRLLPRRRGIYDRPGDWPLAWACPSRGKDPKAEAHCAVCHLMPDSSQHWTMAHSMATPSSAGWTVLPGIRPHGNGPIPRQPGPGSSMTAGSHPAGQHCLGRSSPGRCFKPICAGKVPRPPKSEDRGAQQTRGTPPAPRANASAEHRRTQPGNAVGTVSCRAFLSSTH